MALIIDTISPQGFSAKDAYCRVNLLTLISKNKISFSVQSLKNKEAAISFHSEQYACTYDLEGNNPIAQAYYFLKTLPEFSGAKDG